MKTKCRMANNDMCYSPNAIKMLPSLHVSRPWWSPLPCSLVCLFDSSANVFSNIFSYFVFRVIAYITALSRGPGLLHAAPQHLVGRDKHDANDEGNGKSAYQALAHARLFDLLRRAGTCGRGRRVLVVRLATRPWSAGHVSWSTPKERAQHKISHVLWHAIIRRALFHTCLWHQD